jgi:hypothetical protein
VHLAERSHLKHTRGKKICFKDQSNLNTCLLFDAPYLSSFCERLKDYIVKAATAFESSFFITAETS